MSVRAGGRAGGQARQAGRQAGRAGMPGRQAATNRPPSRLAPQERAQQRSSSAELCNALALGRICSRGDACRLNHDLEAYLGLKPPAPPGGCPFQAADACPYGARASGGGLPNVRGAVERQGGRCLPRRACAPPARAGSEDCRRCSDGRRLPRCRPVRGAALPAWGAPLGPRPCPGGPLRRAPQASRAIGRRGTTSPTRCPGITGSGWQVPALRGPRDWRQMPRDWRQTSRCCSRSRMRALPTARPPKPHRRLLRLSAIPGGGAATAPCRHRCWSCLCRPRTGRR